jgi:pimeloyl-ACP methyl ester carboxylesterase
MSDNSELKYVKCEYGKMSYHLHKSGAGFYNVWLHGFGLLPKIWFEEQAEEYGLDKHNWILPNYMGYAESDIPPDEQAYTMKQTATDVLQILIRDEIEEVVIYAHSLGGAVASHLISEIAKYNNHFTSKIKIRRLNYIEGNLDKGDAFLTGSIASLPFEKFEKNSEQRNFKPTSDNQDRFSQYILKHGEELLKIDNYTLWASAKDLYKESCSGQILDNLVHHSNLMAFPMIFYFGEKNKGKYSSEELLRENNLEIGMNFSRNLLIITNRV